MFVCCTLTRTHAFLYCVYNFIELVMFVCCTLTRTHAFLYCVYNFIELVMFVCCTLTPFYISHTGKEGQSYDIYIYINRHACIDLTRRVDYARNYAAHYIQFTS